MQAGVFDLQSLSPKSFRKPRSPANIQTEAFSVTSNARQYVSHSDDNCKQTWVERLFGFSKKPPQTLKPDDLRRFDPDSGDSIFPRRSMSAKSALDPRLRCTEVDGDGKVIMVDGEFKKSELIARVRTPHATEPHDPVVG